jgi:hypothetical protein
MILKMRMLMIGLLTILFSVVFADNADARGCGCHTHRHTTYGYHTGYYRPAVRHHVYYRPFYGYRRGLGHVKKYKLKIKREL